MAEAFLNLVWQASALLAAYEEPRLDEGIAEGLRDFIARREEELPNSVS